MSHDVKCHINFVCVAGLDYHTKKILPLNAPHNWGMSSWQWCTPPSAEICGRWNITSYWTNNNKTLISTSGETPLYGYNHDVWQSNAMYSVILGGSSWSIPLQLQLQFMCPFGLHYTDNFTWLEQHLWGFRVWVTQHVTLIVIWQKHVCKYKLGLKVMRYGSQNQRT